MGIKFAFLFSQEVKPSVSVKGGVKWDTFSDEENCYSSDEVKGAMLLYTSWVYIREQKYEENFIVTDQVSLRN